MKRTMLVILSLLLFVGCQYQTAAPVQPVNLYYQRDELQYGVEDGIIAAEVVDMEGESLDYLQLLRRYLEGPDTAGLSLPIPAGVNLLSFSLENHLATVTMSREMSLLTGYNLTIGASCMAKTLLQFEQIHTVRIYADKSLLDGREYLEFTADSLLMTDSGAVENRRLQLYFADDSYRFLLERVVTVNEIDPEQLPEYALEQLIAGPTDADARPVIPPDTMLLDVSLEGGTCIVDFSEDFLTGKPETWLQERASIFAVVNTLADLEDVEQVQILVEGESLPRYLYLDLSKPLTPDLQMLGPVREGLGEFEASLCLPLIGRSGYYACPVRILEKPMAEPAQLALEALIKYPKVSCYEQQLPESLTIQSFTYDQEYCYVDCSSDPLENCESTEQMERCLQSMVLTVSRILPVTAMQITVNGTPLQQWHTFDPDALRPMGRYLHT